MSGTHPSRSKFLQEARIRAQTQLKEQSLRSFTPSNQSPLIENEKWFVRALYDYKSDPPYTISILEGDVLSVLNENGEWLMCLKGEDFGWIPGNYVEKIEPNLIPREYKFDEEIAEELDLINQKNAKSQTEILHMKEKLEEVEEKHLTCWSHNYEDEFKKNMICEYYEITVIQELSFHVHFLIELIEMQSQLHSEAQHTKDILSALDSLISKMNSISHASLRKNKIKIETIAKDFKILIEKKKPIFLSNESVLKILCELAKFLDENKNSVV